MAFEPEHAMVFAQPARGRRSRGIKTSPDQSEQVPLAASEQTAENRSGYLHSYRTAKDLRLLYIDGTSAGKSRVGTLDSQDRILFNESPMRIAYSHRAGHRVSDELGNSPLF